MTNALAKLDKATQMLAEAKSLDEVKHIMDIAEAARTYARAAKLGLDAQNHAAEIKLRAERKAGELLLNLERGKNPKDNTGKFTVNTSVDNTASEYREVLDSEEIPNTTAHRWQSLAKLPERSFENYITEKSDSKQEITTAGVLKLVSNHHVSDDTYDWYTPAEYIEAARSVMGSIDIDPASSETAQAVIKAKKYFTKETDGLISVWSGNMWMNPPYDMPNIELFIGKAVQHFAEGKIKQAIILTNNSSDTAWFHLLAEHPFCLTRGRIQFWNAEGKTLATRQGQAIFYLGDNVSGFVKEFSEFGIVVGKL
jgi:phage N-6-adenine-methyltransferase